MKKNKFMRIACTLLVLTLLSTCAISGTFAKYVSTTTGSDSARVAKWAFDVGTNAALAETFTFDLFASIKDTGGSATESDVDIDGSGSESVIAPGTQGSFEIVLKNESEVNATYAIDYTVSANGIPMEFSTDGTTWSTELADITAQDITMNDGTDGSGDDEKTVTVHWRWAFLTYKASADTEVQDGKKYYTFAEGTYTEVTSPANNPSTSSYYELADAADTTLGTTTEAPTVTVTAKVTLTQVD